MVCLANGKLTTLVWRLYDFHTFLLPLALQSVLEKEAAVLQDPTNAQAWYDLGIKQQENEREPQAILALSKSISLSLSSAPLATTFDFPASVQIRPAEVTRQLAAAHLALSISHTNNADRPATLLALSTWVETIAKLSEPYATVLQKQPAMLGMSPRERHDWLVGVLVEFARCGVLGVGVGAEGRESERGVDADVQIALGVLFNTSGVCYQLSLATDDVRCFGQLYH